MILVSNRSRSITRCCGVSSQEPNAKFWSDTPHVTSKYTFSIFFSILFYDFRCSAKVINFAMVTFFRVQCKTYLDDIYGTDNYYIVTLKRDLEFGPEFRDFVSPLHIASHQPPETSNSLVNNNSVFLCVPWWLFINILMEDFSIMFGRKTEVLFQNIKSISDIILIYVI
jgi:hypothetical protein